MLDFIAGLFTGAMIAIAVMCLLLVGKKADEN